MNKIKFNIIVFILIIFEVTNLYGQLPSSDTAYEIVFSDEFNGTRLDSSKWLLRFPWHQSSNYNLFWCNPTPNPVPMASVNTWVGFDDHTLNTENCPVDSGTLKLITKKENHWGEVWNWPNGNFQRDTLLFNFTTAMLYSKFDFRYGYFEIKFKLPALPPSPKTYKGHGGTFWLWSGGYNYWSEIDMFEINAYDVNTNSYYQTGCNTHFQETSSSPHITEGLPYYNPGFQPNTWHTIGMNWTSTAIDFYVDGVRQYTAHNHPDSLQPMSIIINCGGNYTPLDNYCVPFDTINSNGTHFPYTYEIDYVKVWQLKKDCNTNLSLSTFNPTTYPNEIHKSVTMGSNISITNQTNQSFWGSDYILINEGTSVDNQSNVLFNVTNCDNISIVRKINANDKSSGDYNIPPPPSFIYKINNEY